MNVPNLPTDNLYKFIAISGVTLCISCLALNTFAYQNFSERRVELLGQLQSIKSDQDEINVSVETLDISKKQIDAVKTKLESAGNEVRALREPFDKSTRWYNAGAIIGFLGAIFGFVLWYFRVQKYEDILLINKVKSK
jgi:hypothetical protein